MGIFLFPSPHSWEFVKDQMVQIIQHVCLRQRGLADIRDLACDFLSVINDLDSEDNNDLKEVFNSCLDNSLSPWEMESLGSLTFWEFVYQIYYHGGALFAGLGRAPSFTPPPTTTLR
ncbi:glycine-rich RNA-binding 1-like protein [Labeo rohita]|uniref:Glycine-rich RNA-binding 1-like protein n=1 Tax=Labeo rohita TaxID=84645 RepID=A0A498M1J5_LABRO|nr:glycine-rich RNA-binding 1-like protein [Labeo rohita]